MAKLNLVLVEPEIPQNTGNIARTCAATGAVLHIVKPMGFEIDDKKLKRAGLDYWYLLDIRYYENIEDFFEKNKGTYYFLTRYGHKPHTSFDYSDTSKNIYFVLILLLHHIHLRLQFHYYFLKILSIVQKYVSLNHYRKNYIYLLLGIEISNLHLICQYAKVYLL